MDRIQMLFLVRAYYAAHKVLHYLPGTLVRLKLEFSKDIFLIKKKASLRYGYDTENISHLQLKYYVRLESDIKKV